LRKTSSGLLWYCFAPKLGHTENEYLCRQPMFHHRIRDLSQPVSPPKAFGRDSHRESSRKRGLFVPRNSDKSSGGRPHSWDIHQAVWSYYRNELSFVHLTVDSNSALGRHQDTSCVSISSVPSALVYSASTFDVIFVCSNAESLFSLQPSEFLSSSQTSIRKHLTWGLLHFHQLKYNEKKRTKTIYNFLSRM
jgi:hypothetical protein